MEGNLDETLHRLKRLFLRLSIHDNRYEERKGKTMTCGSFEAKFNGKMSGKSEREATFIRNGWSSIVSTSEMSSAGFCCMGKNGPVVCFQCKGVIVDSWVAGDIPLTIHRKVFPKCNFAKTEKQQTKVRGGGPFRQRGTVFDAVCTTKNVVDNMNSGNNQFEDSTQNTSSTQDYFRVEYNRLVTFLNWPEDSPVEGSTLAAAGLYRLGDASDLVKCFACLTEIEGWNDGDVPMVKHINQSPRCPFVNQRDTGNRRITEHEKQQAAAVFQQSRPQHPTDQMTQSSSTGIVTSTSEEPPRSVRYKQYCKKEDRMRTFASWPKDHCQPPETLARAGFFSVGKKDQVACFACGGELLDWEPEDDPFEEHARHYPGCRWIEMERCKNRVIEKRKQLGVNDDDTETGEEEHQQNTSTGDEEKRTTIEYEPGEDGSGKRALPPGGGGTRGNSPKRNDTPTKRAVKDDSDNREEESHMTNVIEKLHIGGEKTHKPRDKNKEDISAEVEIIRDRNLCKICMDQDVEMLFLPCKHLSVCEPCAKKVELCPICREYIDERIFVFVT